MEAPWAATVRTLSRAGRLAAMDVQGSRVASKPFANTASGRGSSVDVRHSEKSLVSPKGLVAVAVIAVPGTTSISETKVEKPVVQLLAVQATQMPPPGGQ